MTKKSLVEKIDILYTNIFYFLRHRHHNRDQQLIMSHPKDTAWVNELARAAHWQVSKFRSGDTGVTGNQFEAVPLDRHSCAPLNSIDTVQWCALTTELQRSTGAKLRCRGRLCTFLPNPFICFEYFSNIELKNEGIISEVNHQQQQQQAHFGFKPSLAEPITGLMTAACYDWPTKTAKLARAQCVILFAETNRSRCDLSASTNMAAGWRTR